MATQLGALYTSLTLQAQQFFNGLNQATTASNRASLAITSAMNAAKGAVVGFAAAFSVDKIMSATKAALDHADAITDLSAQTGISAKMLQEFRYAAQLSGSSVESADAAVKKFAKALGEAQRGGAAQVEMLDELGVRNTDYDTALRQSIDGISRLKTTQEQNAVAMNLFGKSAADLTILLAGGTKGFDELAAEAAQMGIVLDGDLLAGMGAVNDKLDTMKFIMGAQFTKIIADNASSLIDLANALMSVANGVSSVFRQLKGTSAIYRDRGILGVLTASGDELAAAGTARGVAAMRRKALAQAIEDRKAAEASVGKWYNRKGHNAVRAREVEAEARRRLNETLNSARYKAETAPAVSTNPPTGGEEFEVEPTDKPTKAAGLSDAARAAQAAQQRIDDLIASLTFEEAQLGRTDREQAIYNNLKSAGVDITSAAGEAIAAQTGRLYDQREALRIAADSTNAFTKSIGDLLDEMEEAEKRGRDFFAESIGKAIEEAEAKTEESKQRLLDFATDVAANFSSAFEAMLLGGESLREIIGGLIKDFAALILRMTVLEPMARAVAAAVDSIGKGGGGGFLGKLLGFAAKVGTKLATGGAGDGGWDWDASEIPGGIGDGSGILAAIDGARAGGGPVRGGGMYLVGERGPELFRPKSGGTIVPNHALGGGGQTIHVDARGATDPAETRRMVAEGIAMAMPIINRQAVDATMTKLRRPGM